MYSKHIQQTHTVWRKGSLKIDFYEFVCCFERETESSSLKCFFWLTNHENAFIVYHNSLTRHLNIIYYFSTLYTMYSLTRLIWSAVQKSHRSFLSCTYNLTFGCFFGHTANLNWLILQTTEHWHLHMRSVWPLIALGSWVLWPCSVTPHHTARAQNHMITNTCVSYFLLRLSSH